MADQVQVEMVEVETVAQPPGARIEYRVRNVGAAPVWLVDDGWLSFEQRGAEIELSYARGWLRPGAEPFGYFLPKVVEIGPGQTVTRERRLSWPQRLDRLWNDRQQADPPPGRYRLRVRVGYGLTPEPPADAPGRAEERVLGWQREAVGEPVGLVVPAYERS